LRPPHVARAWSAAGLVAVALLSPWAAAQAAPDARETKKLHVLFDEQWEADARAYPEESTERGDFRFNDKLTDMSATGIEARDAQDRAFLAKAKAIHRDQLADKDRISLDLFIEILGFRVDKQAFAGYRDMRIHALGGAQTLLAGLMREVPMDTAAHARQLLGRLAAYPRRMDDEIAMMRRGIALGWVPSRDVLQRGLRMIDDQLDRPLETSPHFQPFDRIGKQVPEAERERLRAAGRQAVETQVRPSLRKLRAFIVDEYLPAAPQDGSLAHYPGGDRVYAYLAHVGTTTKLPPKQIHEMGLRELASVRAEMEGIVKQVGFTGSFRDFTRELYTNPKYINASPEAQLAMYRDIGKRADAELPRFFAELPRLTYGVRAMPEYAGPDAAEYYDPPAVDGTRAGYFNANAQGYRTRPKWTMASLLAHEAVPGHHLQFARAWELKDLPLFQRTYEWNAYSEGWAVYAETIGREMGLYNDPYTLFGHLQARAFRAARLVVDTGIHSFGWPRQKAIDFMVDQTGLDPNFISSEVDRYTSGGGQALGYMVGALKIKELRERAKAKLGDRFDVRRFHNAVLDNGSLPLDVLERLVDEWIAREAAGH
jgi:uncharacterized protein (DUF885 family)